MQPDAPLTPLEPWCAAKIGAPGPFLSRAALEAYQLERLNATLRLAQNSPFYRQHLAGAPSALTSLDELPLLPFTTAQHIRDQGLRLLCVSQDAIGRVVTLDSSGTTGSPKRVYFTPADQELTIDFFHHGMSTFTEPGDRVLILLPGELPGSVGDLLATALHRLGAQPIKHGLVRDMDAALAAVRHEGANCVVGAPVQVHALAVYSPGLPIKSVLLSTDYAPSAIVAAIERAWPCTVYNHYGMTEMGLGGGVECCARRGYHLREADLLFEVVEPATGAPVAPGVAGEVVFTTLTRSGMPLLRYRTGDSSRFLVEPCPCGAHLRLMERVRHRLGGVVRIGDGELTQPDLDDALFPIPGLLNFQATLTQRAGGGAPDELLLEANTLEGSATAVTAAMKRVVTEIPAVARALKGGQLSVRVDAQDTGYVFSAAVKRRIRQLSGS